MSVKEYDTVVHVPGDSRGVRRHVREWVCRECDYFEEIDEEDR